jgi:hypothetical protein
MRSGGLGLLGWVGRRTANAFEATVDNTTIAIAIKLFVFMPKIYGRVQSLATTRPWGFPMPWKHGSRLSLEGEGQIKKRWFARRRFQNWRSASARGLRDRPRHGSPIISQRAGIAELIFRITTALSYQHNCQSSAATAIAIRINPQIMDVRLSRRETASSLPRSAHDFKTRRRPSG